MPLEIISQSLILVTRLAHGQSAPELLVGRKGRKLFEGKIVPPGGSAESTELPQNEAARELREETGISVRPDTLREIGRLIIHGPRRFGTIYLYGVEVPPDTATHDTDELHSLEWRPLNDPALTNDMPPDTVIWLPHVLRTEGLVVHIDETEQPPRLTIKQPHHAHDAGEIIEERSL